MVYDRKMELNELGVELAHTIAAAMHEQGVKNKDILAAVADKLGLKSGSAKTYVSQLINGSLTFPSRDSDKARLKLAFDRVQLVLNYLCIDAKNPVVEKMNDYCRDFKPVVLTDVLARPLPAKVKLLQGADKANVETIVNNYLSTYPAKCLK